MTLIKSISGIRGTIGGKTADNLTPIDAVKFTSAYGAFIIARNSIMDFFRTSKIRSELPDLTAEIDTEENFHTEKECLLGILQNLPKKYRTPLFLSDIKGMKQSEVAKLLHQNLPTTKSQIQRARKLIAQGFMDCCGFVMNDQGLLVGEIKEKENCKVCN